MTIYKRFVICFNTLNGPLSRLTTQYILANIRTGGYVYCMWLSSVNSRVQASAMLIFFILEYE